MDPERLVIAIDLGGTKVSLAIITAGGRIRRRVVLAAPVVPPSDAIEGLARRVRRWPEAATAEAVGMAMPAVLDEEGRVAWAAASVAGWQDAHALMLLEHAFERPAAVRFDGYAATLGEAVFGPGRGRHSLVALIVGTGFGAGVWAEGRVLQGAIGVAGAVGWTRWPVGDREVTEPAEHLVSGPGILRAARLLAPDEDFADARHVFRAARSGHPAARAAVAEAAHVAGTIAGAVVNVIAPEVVVWTGGVGSRADFAAPASRTARRCCQPFAAERTLFVRSALGAESSLMGAAAAALQLPAGRVLA